MEARYGSFTGRIAPDHGCWRGWRTGIYLYGYLLVLGGRVGSLCLVFPLYGGGILGCPEMGSQRRRAPCRPVVVVYCLYYGAFHRCPPVKPAGHPGHCTGYLFQISEERSVVKACVST